MKRPKISVLVPIYNSSEYLEDCLNSLKKQSMKEIEFVLVNDGSTDDSLKIINRYVKHDDRFKLINKKNTGYGDSLNQAIEKATGSYIGIVEPDDFCDEEMFEVLYKNIKDVDADISIGGYYYFNKNHKEKNAFKFFKKEKSVFCPCVDYKIFYEEPAIWSAIYKKNLIINNGINFLPTPGASYQDTGFNFKTLACAKKVVYIEKPLYYYRNDNINSSVKSQSKVMAVVDEYDEIERFIKGVDNSDLLLKYCQVAKFGAYNWNLLRLPKEMVKKFIKYMKKDFAAGKKNGYVDKKFFPKKYWWALKVLLNCPCFVYYCLISFKKKVL